MRGRRLDIPKNGSAWVDPMPPAPNWQYWEMQFSRKFSASFRRKILVTRADFRFAHKSRSSDERPNFKELRRELQRIANGNAARRTFVTEFVQKHTLDYFEQNPDASLSEACRFLLFELERYPDEFGMSGPKPEVAYSYIFLELFKENGFDCSLSSRAMIDGMSGTCVAPTKPVEDFIGQEVWGSSQLNVSEVRKIHQCIQRIKRSL